MNTPRSTRSASSGGSGTAAHNRYPLDYHRSASEVTRHLEQRSGKRLARFVRSGWTGAAPHSPIVWGGDPTCSWGFDGLSSAVTEGLSMGASGIAMFGSDTGGFVSSVDRLTPELLRRWIQFSSCCPVMRTKSSGIEQPSYRRPQILGPGRRCVLGQMGGLAHAAERLPLGGARRVPTDGGPDHAGPQPRLARISRGARVRGPIPPRA